MFSVMHTLLLPCFFLLSPLGDSRMLAGGGGGIASRGTRTAFRKFNPHTRAKGKGPFGKALRFHLHPKKGHMIRASAPEPPPLMGRSHLTSENLGKQSTQLSFHGMMNWNAALDSSFLQSSLLKGELQFSRNVLSATTETFATKRGSPITRIKHLLELRILMEQGEEEIRSLLAKIVKAEAEVMQSAQQLHKTQVQESMPLVRNLRSVVEGNFPSLKASLESHAEVTRSARAALEEAIATKKAEVGSGKDFVFTIAERQQAFGFLKDTNFQDIFKGVRKVEVDLHKIMVECVEVKTVGAKQYRALMKKMFEPLERKAEMESKVIMDRMKPFFFWSLAGAYAANEVFNDGGGAESGEAPLTKSALTAAQQVKKLEEEVKVARRTRSENAQKVLKIEFVGDEIQEFEREMADDEGLLMKEAKRVFSSSSAKIDAMEQILQRMLLRCQEVHMKGTGTLGFNGALEEGDLKLAFAFLAHENSVTSAYLKLILKAQGEIMRLKEELPSRRVMWSRELKLAILPFSAEATVLKNAVKNLRTKAHDLYIDFAEGLISSEQRLVSKTTEFYLNKLSVLEESPAASGVEKVDIDALTRELRVTVESVRFESDEADAYGSALAACRELDKFPTEEKVESHEFLQELMWKEEDLFIKLTNLEDSSTMSVGEEFFRSYEKALEDFKRALKKGDEAAQATARGELSHLSRAFAVFLEKKFYQQTIEDGMAAERFLEGVEVMEKAALSHLANPPSEVQDGPESLPPPQLEAMERGMEEMYEEGKVLAERIRSAEVVTETRMVMGRQKRVEMKVLD